MDNPAVAGIEVSADVLVLAFDNGQLRSTEFPNTAAGHQHMLRFLHKNATQVSFCTSNPESKSWRPTHVRCVILAGP
jgi:hypothetical protein